MKWNSEEGYYDYTMALDTLEETLGIGTVDFLVRSELAPYLTKILQYINKNIIKEVGLDAETLDKINVVQDLFDEGADLICTERALILAEKVDVLDESEDDETKYDQDRFVFCWSNVLSSLLTRLKIMYSSLLTEEEDYDCPCCCHKGQTWEDWEDYTSKVWPEDENYDYSGSDEVTIKKSKCGCAYRYN
jgi:hypothetical protein